MTPKERFAATLNDEPVDRIPVFDMSIMVLSKLAGYTWKDIRFDAKASTKSALEYDKKVNPDFLMGCMELNGMFFDLGIEYSSPDDNYCNIKGAYYDEPEDVDAKALPDVSDRKACPALWSTLIDKSAHLYDNYKGDAILGGTCWGPFTTAAFLRGVETFLMDIIMEPDVATKVMEKGTKYFDAIGREILACGGDFFNVPDPTSSGDLINDQTYAEFCVPALRSTAKVWGKEFDRPIGLHICGNTEVLTDQIAAAGLDAFSADHAVDLGSMYKKMAGRTTMMGNVDPVQTVWMGSRDAVIKESKECIEACKEYRKFILCTGCEIPRDTALENITALFEAADKYGRY
ncbi:MAG: hypothetical protein GX224_01575 [Thermoplasmatales archaeon]|nr:hypothetical protein [Thermoplasmatales archaeon]